MNTVSFEKQITWLRPLEVHLNFFLLNLLNKRRTIGLFASLYFKPMSRTANISYYEFCYFNSPSLNNQRYVYTIRLQ